MTHRKGISAPRLVLQQCEESPPRPLRIRRAVPPGRHLVDIALMWDQPFFQASMSPWWNSSADSDMQTMFMQGLGLRVCHTYRFQSILLPPNLSTDSIQWKELSNKKWFFKFYLNKTVCLSSLYLSPYRETHSLSKQRPIKQYSVISLNRDHNVLKGIFWTIGFRGPDPRVRVYSMVCLRAWGTHCSAGTDEIGELSPVPGLGPAVAHPGEVCKVSHLCRGSAGLAVSS